MFVGQDLSPLFLFLRKLGFNFLDGEMLSAVKNQDYCSAAFKAPSLQSGVFCFAKLKFFQQNPEVIFSPLIF